VQEAAHQGRAINGNALKIRQKSSCFRVVHVVAKPLVRRRRGS
jgi:hypothetical protein